MKNSKTKSSLTFYPTDHETEVFRKVDEQATYGTKDLQSRLEWNELLTGEIEALKRLEGLDERNRNHAPALIETEIQRRREFLKTLLSIC
jgi:hypothetical protein